MNLMFNGCSSLIDLCNISGWNVSSVEDMRYLFNGCVSLTSMENLSAWDVSSVTNMSLMFSGCSKLTSINFLSSWDVSSVETMYAMFQNCNKLESLVGISSWDVSSVKTIRQMFFRCSNLTSLDLSGWKLSSLEDEVSDTSTYSPTLNVVNGCSALVEIKAPKTINGGYTIMLPTYTSWYISDKTDTVVTEISSGNSTIGKTLKAGIVVTFNANGGDVNPATAVALSGETITLPTPTKIGCTFLGWYTAAEGGTKVGDAGVSYTVTSATTLYAKWKALPAYLNSNWKNLVANAGVGITTALNDNNIATIEFATSMPSGYNANNYIPVGATSRTSTTVNDSVVAYYKANSKNSSQFDLAIVGAGGQTIYAPINSSGLFKELTALTTIGFNNFSTEGVTNMSSMFAGKIQSGTYYNMSLTSLNLSGWDVSNVTSMSSMFNFCSSLTSVGELNNWKVAKVTNMNSMFSGCKLLTSVGDLSGWNVSNVTSMSTMFYGCSSLTSVGDLSGWNVSNVTSMRSMFNNCSSLTSLDLSGWNVSNVTSMSQMFFNCSSLTSIGYLSGWNVSNVKDMSYMFNNCSSLTSVGDLSGWIVSNVTNMNYMFNNCSSLTSVGDLSEWKVSNVTSMGFMFFGCKLLTNIGDLSGWDVSNVTNMRYMFYRCSSLTSLDLSGWELESLEMQTSGSDTYSPTQDMLTGCTALTQIKAPKEIKGGYAITLPSISGKKWVIKGTSTVVTEITTGNDTLNATLVLIDA